jgi:DNA-binding MarR family transcriptional regulator
VAMATNSDRVRPAKSEPHVPKGSARDERTVEDLERALFSVARSILRMGIPSHALRAGEHIDRAGYWLLTRLDESTTPVRLSDLAALLELDLSTVSRQARQLVDGGLVTRVADAVDGRACRLSVSDRGRAVLEAVRDSRHEVLRRALHGWAPTDRATLADALARLATDIQAKEIGGSP